MRWRRFDSKRRRQDAGLSGVQCLVSSVLCLTIALLCIAMTWESDEIKRVVLAESFCADWDAESSAANRVLERLAEELQSELLVLEYHIWDDSPDLYPEASQKDNAQRYNWYVPEQQEQGLPDVFFNGLNQRPHADAIEPDQVYKK